MHQTTMQEDTKVPATTDNLLMVNRHKGVKLEVNREVNKEVMGSKVVLMDNSKEAVMVNKGDNRVLLTVNNKVPPTDNKVLDNTTPIIVQRK